VVGVVVFVVVVVITAAVIEKGKKGVDVEG
jgi:flagellar biosynthesis component FlhA